MLATVCHVSPPTSEAQHQEDDLAFLSTTSRPITTSTIMSVCKRMVAVAGLQVNMSSHLLQSSGTTATMEGRLSQEQIMAVGGWLAV